MCQNSLYKINFGKKKHISSFPLPSMGKTKKIVSKFFDACTLGQTQLIKQFLTEDPELISINDDKHFSALHIAVLGGQISSVLVLLNWGADPNSLTANLQTPLILAVRNGYFQVSTNFCC